MPQMQMARPISSACLRKIRLSICVYDPRSGEHSRLKAAWLPKTVASSTKSALKPRQYTADAPMRRVAGAISSVLESSVTLGSTQHTQVSTHLGQ
jgi:hypothetical protein